MARLVPLAQPLGVFRQTHQPIGQFGQFGVVGVLGDGGGDILRGAPHGEPAVGEIGGLLSTENYRVLGNSGARQALSMFVGTLAAGLPAVSAAAADLRIGDLPSAPRTR